VLLSALTSDEALFAYAAFPVAIVAAVPALRRRDASEAIRIASGVLFTAALLVMLSRTLIGSSTPTGRVNLVPGATVPDLSGRHAPDAVKNILGNLALFAPLGLFGRLAFRCSILTATAAGCCLSIAVETAQFALGDRWVDIDDVILNTTGALVGAMTVGIGARLAEARARARAL
jgi:glycopeptide antibiotics resistance protein